MKKWFGLSLALIVCLTFVILTFAESTPAETPAVPRHASAPLAGYELRAAQRDAYSYQLSNYDLGAREYTAPSGKTMPYRVRGVLAVPQGDGPFPLAVLLHGSHSNEDESLRFDTGLTYLSEALAARGYIAVSIDLSAAYQWKYGDSDDLEKTLHIAGENLRALQNAHEGAADDFSISLAGKIDFSNVAYLGHSRGGNAVFDLALAQQAQGISAKAVLSVAPAAPADIEEKTFPDVMTSILVPEYDGDIVSLDGFAFGEVLRQKNSAPAYVTLLKRANHNFFNTALSANDALLAQDESAIADQLSAQQQQAFLAEFAGDFLDAAIKNSVKGSLYDHGAPSPNRMYGLDVLVQVPQSRVLFNASQSDALEAADPQAIEVTIAQDSWFYEKDEMALDSLTFGRGAYQTRSLLRLRFEEPGFVSLAPAQKDFSSYASLSLRIALDPADEFNEEHPTQGFGVMLRDVAGNTAMVVLSEGQNVLARTSGMLDRTPMFDKDYVFWSRPTPMGSIRIPLSAFSGVDLSHILDVTLVFESAPGSYVLESIGLS